MLRCPQKLIALEISRNYSAKRKQDIQELELVWENCLSKAQVEKWYNQQNVIFFKKPLDTDLKKEEFCFQNIRSVGGWFSAYAGI